MSGGGDRLNPLTFISLFSGIGGLDLGLERAGFKLIAHSEIEPYCCRVLKKQWPDVPNLGDVRTVDWSTVERPDLICGGYPCQPFSLAGARRGEADERHLWPAMRDAIGVLRPRFALLENVPGHLSLGFDRVLGDLADCGYDAEWDCIPAAAVGAPHLRYRLFVVAYTDGRGLAQRGEPDSGSLERGDESPRRDHAGRLRADVADTEGRTGRTNGTSISGPASSWGFGGRSSPVFVADPACSGRDERQHGHDPSARGVPVAVGGSGRVGDAIGAPEDAQPAQGGSRSTAGESGWWAVEPSVGRVAHGIPCRVDRLRALGNAVVPQVAEWIGAQLLDSLERVGVIGDRLNLSARRATVSYDKTPPVRERQFEDHVEPPIVLVLVWPCIAWLVGYRT